MPDLDFHTQTYTDALAYLLTELSFAAIDGVEVQANGSLRVTFGGRLFLVGLGDWVDVTDEAEGEDG